MCTTSHHTFSPCAHQHIHTHRPCQSHVPTPHAYWTPLSSAPHPEEIVSPGDPGYPCPICTRVQQSPLQSHPQSQLQDGGEEEITDGVRLLWPRENQRGGFGERLLLGTGGWVPQALERERAFPYPVAEPAGFRERNGWLLAPAAGPEAEIVRDRTAVLKLEREVWDSAVKAPSFSADRSQVVVEALEEGSSSSPIRPADHANQASEHTRHPSRRIEQDAFAYQLEATRHQQPRRDVQTYQRSPPIFRPLRGNALGREISSRPITSPFPPVNQSQDTFQRLRNEYGSYQYQPNTSRIVAPKDRSINRIGPLESRQFRAHREHAERLRRHQREEHQSFLQRHQSSTQQSPDRSQSSDTTQPFNFNPQTGDRGEFIPGAGRWVSDRRSRLQRQREDVLRRPSGPASRMDGSAEERSVEWE